MKRNLTLLLVVIMLFMIKVSTAGAVDLILVASDAMLKSAEPWVSFLKSKEVPVKSVSPKAFADNKEAPYVVIMGGVSEAGGIGDIIKKALGEKDFTAIGKGEAKGMYLKYNVWSGGQEIIVFAAANAADVGAVRKESRSDWWETISEWFEIEDEETSEGGGTPAY